MFTKVNYINVTIWVLSSLLLLITLALIIWRLATKEKTQNVRKNEIWKTSNDLKDISHSIYSTYNIPSLVNVLFKNRFSKNKFSIITMLAFKNNNAFLIANPIYLKKVDDVSLNNNEIIFYFKGKTKSISIKHHKEVLRFLKSIELNCELLVPIETNINKRFENIYILSVADLGEYINNNERNMNSKNTMQFIKRINKLNLFKKKTTRKEL